MPYGWSSWTREQKDQFLRRVRDEETKKRRVAQNPPREIIRNARKNARARGLAFEITEDDLSWPTHCPVFGMELHYPGRFRNDPAGLSLDRINSYLPYIKGNVIVVSFRANELKRNATVTELKALADFYSNLKMGGSFPNSDVPQALHS